MIQCDRAVQGSCSPVGRPIVCKLHALVVESEQGMKQPHRDLEQTRLLLLNLIDVVPHQNWSTLQACQGQSMHITSRPAWPK